MARHFAEIVGGDVKRVILADSAAWCVANLGGQWVETYNPSEPPTAKELANDSRVLSVKNYAGIGHAWDVERQGFIAPRPKDPLTKEVFESWPLDEATLIYKPPVPYPKDKTVPQAKDA